MLMTCYKKVRAVRYMAEGHPLADAHGMVSLASMYAPDRWVVSYKVGEFAGAPLLPLWAYTDRKYTESNRLSYVTCDAADDETLIIWTGMRVLWGLGRPVTRSLTLGSELRRNNPSGCSALELYGETEGGLNEPVKVKPCTGSIVLLDWFLPLVDFTPDRKESSYYRVDEMAREPSLDGFVDVIRAQIPDEDFRLWLKEHTRDKLRDSW